MDRLGLEVGNDMSGMKSGIQRELVGWSRICPRLECEVDLAG